MALMVTAGLLYPPTMLDSLSYRLPRIFAWLQEGHIQYLPSSEERLNYMPHSWSLCILPLLQASGDRLEWVWSFVSWIALSLMAYEWALELNTDLQGEASVRPGGRSRARQMAFIAATSMFAVLQAESSANDLFATATLLLALRFVMDFEKTRRWTEINWAVLSFCLAGGTKPQYCVFGLPLMLWFFAAPSKPWKSFRWIWTPVVAVVWVLCSPVPSFAMNVHTYGTIAGPGLNQSITGKGPPWNWVLGGTMIAWQAIQPPVSPAGLFNDRLSKAVEKSGLQKVTPRFNLRVSLVCLVDTASLGLVASAAWAWGIYLALRHRRVSWQSWRTLALMAGVFSLFIALSRMVSETCGRANCGFLYFALPLSMAGWSLISVRKMKVVFYLSLLSALTALILNPARPLWPSQWAHNELDRSVRFNWLDSKLEPYFKFTERATTARELITRIPLKEKQFVVLAGDDRPLLPMFRPYDSGRKVLFLSNHSAPDSLNQLAVNYVIIGGGAEDDFPELCAYLRQTNDFELIESRDYTSKLKRGAETWQLFRRRPEPESRTDSAAARQH